MSKSTVDGLKNLTTKFLNENAYFIEGSHKKGTVHWSVNGEKAGRIDISVDMTLTVPKIYFDYKVRLHGEEWKDMKYSFSLLSIPCNYGGKRWYFQCCLYREGMFCGKRVTTLYQCGDYFACRHCADLSYDSRNESKRLRYGELGLLKKCWDAENYYKEHVKRTHYAGKPTRQYRRYLRLLGE